MIANLSLFSIAAVALVVHSPDNDASLCPLYAQQVEEAAIVDLVLRRNWEPGASHTVEGAPVPIYSDTVAFHIDNAHIDLISRFVDRCVDWLNEAPAVEIPGHSIWLLMQHNSVSLWQFDQMDVVRALFERELITPREYALFVDRALWRTSEQQQYGTQGRCSPAGFEPFPIRGQDAVDERRRLIGLPTLEEELARMDREACGIVE